MQKKILFGIIIIVVVALIALGGFFAYQYFSVKNPNVQNPNAQNETAGWKTYSDKNWGIEFEYPSNLGEPNIGNFEVLSFYKNNKLESFFLRRSTLQDIEKYLAEEKRCIQENGGLCYAGDLSKKAWQAVKNILESSKSISPAKCILDYSCAYCEIKQIGEIRAYIGHQCDTGEGGITDIKYLFGNDATFHFDFGADEQAVLSTFKFTK